MLSTFDSTLLAIIACACVLYTYKKFGLKSALSIIILGFILSFGYSPYITQYVLKYIGTIEIRPYLLIVLIGVFIFLQFWHKKKNNPLRTTARDYNKFNPIFNQSFLFHFSKGGIMEYLICTLIILVIIGLKIAYDKLG